MNKVPELTTLEDINKAITTLNIPPSSYLIFWIKEDTISICEIGGDTETISGNFDDLTKTKKAVIEWLKQSSETKHRKYIAAGIHAKTSYHPLISDLWLTNDIVPYFLPEGTPSDSEVQCREVFEFRRKFTAEDLVIVKISPSNEVEVAELVQLYDYEQITNKKEFEVLKKLAQELKGKKITIINATPQGGGVALMRHALIRLFHLLDVDAHWNLLTVLKEAFVVTKTKFHNVLQAVASYETRLTHEEQKLYNNWIADNATHLRPSYIDADVVIIDDPQPAGLIPHIKKENPNAKIIYRSHIQIESELANTPNTPQNETWTFLWNFIKDADLFVSHPIPQFIPQEVPEAITVMMPPTTDHLDGLNKPLSKEQISYYLKLFDRILLEDGQTPLDRTRPYIVQIARFDPSKGIPDVLESYKKLRELLENKSVPIPQLIICGHGSIDDPDGAPIINLTMEMVRTKDYEALAQDIKVVRLPSSDQILNALLRESYVCLQLSHKEGYEIKVSEALMKGIPVIAYKAGGIPLQVIDSVSGFLVDVGDTATVAQMLFKLFTDEVFYKEMSQNALKYVNKEVTTVRNAINWMFLAKKLFEDPSQLGGRKTLPELLKEEYPEVEW